MAVLPFPVPEISIPGCYADGVVCRRQASISTWPRRVGGSICDSLAAIASVCVYGAACHITVIILYS